MNERIKVNEPVNFGHQNFRSEINKNGYANWILNYIARQESVMQSILKTYGDSCLFPGGFV
jgi:uncharacterized protein YpiB (UPF0302 family)